MGYIYGLICPTTDKIRYIGQTKNKIKNRLNGHIRKVKHKIKHKTGRLTYKEAWINSLINKNLESKISYVILEEVENKLLNECEIKWISKLKSTSRLTNSTDGGFYTPIKNGENHPHFGRKLSEKAKQKISKANSGKNNGMYGKKIIMTKEHKLKIKKALLNSNKFKKSRQSLEYREKQSIINSKMSVYLLDLNYNILLEFRNLKKVSEYLKCTHGNVKNARRDKRILMKKYYVEYTNDYDKII